MQLTRAIVRPPSDNYAAGLSASGEGAPVLATALAQHAAYCAALAACGLAVEVLPANAEYPDSTFVEDAAILTARGAILTRPGAPTRAGEVDLVRATLASTFGAMPQIAAPGTVDGGDVCEAEDHFLIGVSARTNEAGARQLAGLLGELSYRATVLDIRASPRLLHLKTGIAYLGDGRMVVTPGLPASPALADFELIVVPTGELYAANCIRVNDRVLVASGYPRFAALLEELGYRLCPLEMSEFRRMDGGLSCLSLRF
jgi:dimethylargininase